MKVGSRRRVTRADTSLLAPGGRRSSCPRVGAAYTAFVTLLLQFVALAPSAAASLLPLRTQEAATLPSGSVEVVLGGSYLHRSRFPAFTPNDALRSQELVTAPQLAVQGAVGNWVEIQAFFEMIYLEQTNADGSDLSEFGNGDAQLWTKVRVLREGARWPGAAFRFGAKLPNANKSDHLGTDETDFSIEALLSKQLGPIGLHTNLGIALLGNPGPPIGAPGSSSDGQDDLFTYGVAITSPSWTVPATSSLAIRFLSEVAGTAGSRFDNDRSVARIGLQLSPGALSGYLGTSFGLASGSEDVGVTAGMLYVFTLERLVGGSE